MNITIIILGILAFTFIWLFIPIILWIFHKDWENHVKTFSERYKKGGLFK